MAVRWIQWGTLVLAATVLLVFLLSQRQTSDFLYGTQQVGDSADPGNKDGPAPPVAHAGKLPSDAELTADLARSTIVRLPGAVATFDEPKVLAAIAHADQIRTRKPDPEPKIKVIVAPPDLSDADRERLLALPGDNVRVVGLSVTFAAYDIMPSDTAGWQQQFVTGDVTSLILSRIAQVLDEPEPTDVPLQWRTPTADELRTVLDGLGPATPEGRLYAAPGADLTAIPKVAAQAFPARPPIVLALPRQQRGAAVPDYGSALAKAFPDTPIVVMYGYWCGYTGPFDDNTAVATAAYYSRYGPTISDNAFPQANVLNVYLQQWARIRFAGLFDRPLPYAPPDPVGIALPALPWTFLACVLVFVGVSVQTIRRRREPAADIDLHPPADPPAGSTSAWDRLAGLSALAVELSGLADDRANAGLTRGVFRLRAAREALDAGRGATIVGAQLDAAGKEFDAIADLLGRPDYRPDNYLAGRPS
jgi:hypothetical protein